VKIAKRYKEEFLPFEIMATDESLTARSGLLLPDEMLKAINLPKVVDKELPTSAEFLALECYWSPARYIVRANSDRPCTE